MMMLALDTCLGPCSVAVLKDGMVVAEEWELTPGQQSRRLVLMMEAALGTAGVDYKDCNAIACTIGPGGFTGARAGITAARAVALVTSKPLMGLTTLEVLAFSANIKGDILAAIDAYRGQWYVQRFRRYDSLLALSEPLLADEKGMRALGHGAKAAPNLVQARNVGALAYEKWMSGERSFPTSPLYIREPDAKLPAKTIEA